MIDPRTLMIKDFTYTLPEEKIAKHPLTERDDSKLLIYKKGLLSEDVYRNISSHLPGNCLMVFNNTKVIEARLIFTKSTGGEIEIFCLEPADRYADITTAMSQLNSVYWKCLVGGASKWKEGMSLENRIANEAGEIVLNAQIIERLSDCFVIKFEWQPGHLAFAELLQYVGQIPLPPYLHRNVEEEDAHRYQTIYAKHDGSVAAPTAGLHFTENVFKSLEQKKINTANVTLHVGAGTFKPVKSSVIAAHEMHAEYIDVSAATLLNIKDNLPGNIIAVGTTSLRTLESLYWLGVKIEADPLISLENLTVHQWDPYDLAHENITPKKALENVQQWLQVRNLESLVTKTQIMIAPGYRLKIANAIVTNFHQPQSTLLLLIAAIVGDEWKNIYNYALGNDYRFLSYGDGCLLFAD